MEDDATSDKRGLRAKGLSQEGRKERWKIDEQEVYRFSKYISCCTVLTVSRHLLRPP